MKILVVGELSKWRQMYIDTVVKHYPDTVIVKQAIGDKINGVGIDFVFYDEFCVAVDKPIITPHLKAILKSSGEIQ